MADGRAERIAALKAELARLEAATEDAPRQHRRQQRLTVRRIETLKIPGFYADGGNLYLDYKDPPGKNWVFRYKRDGVARDMGLGPAAIVGLAEARELAMEARRKLRAGIDPLEEKRAARLAAKLERAKSVTFRQAAELYIAAHEASWKSSKHAAQWPATLAAYAYPAFGDLPVAAIDIGLVLKAIEPIWQTKAETASRTRGRIEAVLSWATTRGYRPKGAPNPAAWKDNLENLLPAKSKIAPTRRHPALPYDQLPEFMARLAEQDGLGALALRLVILTCSRTGEALGGRWAEIDLGRKLWTIPAERMKIKTLGDGSPAPDHRVRLSAPALAILAALPRLEGSPFLFPANRRRSVSNVIMLQLLKRMGRTDLTVHGFRSSFRDWAAETTNHPREASELALAHRVGSEVELSYRRGDMFQKRRVLMDDWARFCTTPAPEGAIVPFAGAAG
jgi:integrase